MKNLLRMTPWLLLATFFYFCALHIEKPQIQTGCWKAGHITLGAYLGYWVDCHLYGHYDARNDYANRTISRAVVVGAAILGMAFGL